MLINIKVCKNRYIESSKRIFGVTGEHNATVLRFTFFEELNGNFVSDFQKYLVVLFEEGEKSYLIGQDNEFEIPLELTESPELLIRVDLKKGKDVIFKSEPKLFTFADSDIVPPSVPKKHPLIGNLEKLLTKNKENLVEAINEVLSSVGVSGKGIKSVYRGYFSEDDSGFGTGTLTDSLIIEYTDDTKSAIPLPDIFKQELTVEETEDGIVINLLDADGTIKLFKIKNGADYVLTEADKTEIANAVLDEIPDISTKTSDYINPYSEGSEVIAETEDEQRVIDAYNAMMSECMGDYNKIPFFAQADNHKYYPKNLYELCGKMMNFGEFSKVLTLGDVAGSYFDEKDLQNFADAMKPFPIEKKITVTGNHDVWKSLADKSYIDQAKLSKYFKNYSVRRYGTNGYGVAIDEYFNIKYLLISNYDKGETDSKISTQQVNFIIEELSKADGYDIVILSHEPISIGDSTATAFLEAGIYTTMGNYFSFISSVNGFISMLLARKNKGSGTYTDDEGVEHTYNFTDCNSDLFCCFCGHTHVEGFDFINNELLIVAYGGMQHTDGHPMYFGYIDRKNRLLKYYRAAGDYSSSVTVGLDRASATDMTLNKTEITMNVGELEVISPIFTPVTAGNQRIVWTSSNEYVATVKKGFVTGINNGTTTITAVSEDGNFTATCLIRVGSGSNEPILVESIILNETAIVKVGKTQVLSVTVNPGNAANKTLEWASSNNSIATVDQNGTVTGVSTGNTTITCFATDGSGVTATCSITVEETVSSNLPSEYQEVEYIYTTKTQVANIQTNTTLMSGDKGYLNVLVTDYGPLAANPAFCGYPGAAEIYITNNSNTFADWQNVKLISPASGTICELNTDYNIEFNITNYISGMFLMAYNSDNKYGMCGRIYSARFVRNNVDIYNFVPCYRKADGKIGMYDTVNNVFAEGVGELFKGEDV